MMKCQDTFGFHITAIFFTQTQLLSSLGVSLSNSASVWQHRSINLYKCCLSKVWRKSRTSNGRHGHYCRDIMSLIECLLWTFCLSSLSLNSPRNTTQKLDKYDRKYPQRCTLLPSPIMSLLTNKWPVPGSAVMASFWKVLAWTSSSSSLRSFSPASSSSSSSRLWERKERMTGEEREEDKHHYFSFHGASAVTENPVRGGTPD